MDVKSILSLPKEHRRLFVALLIAIWIILFLFESYVIPQLPISLHSGLAEYTHALVSAVMVSLFFLWIFSAFLPSDRKSQGLSQIEPVKITPEFEELLGEALRWRYTGNFGRYLRGKVLPTLAGRPNMQISVSIIDPTNKSLCERHAEYRNKIHSIEKGKRYDAKKVALEAIVTIIHCAWYVTNRDTSIDLSLLSMFDPLRIDSNDEAMILTVEDRTRPALKLEKEHFMYEHFDMQMRYERQQGKQIELRGFPTCATISAIKEAEVEDFLTAIGMQELCNDLTTSEIVNGCRTARNPYED